MDKIAVLIPCYNESKTIEKVVKDFKAALPEATVYVFDNNSSIDYIKDEIKKCAFLLKIVPKNELLRRFKIKKRLKFLKKFYEK